MPRHPRLFIPGATYHLFCRVARGEFVFDDDSEAIEFIETLREVRDLDGWSIFAWCLLGNHYHLVVKTGGVDLWRSMARLQGRFSRAYNRRHSYLGRLWQSRYRARVVYTDKYFRQVIAYVHLNPVSAGLADDPGEYVFSGHREIIGACEPHVVDRRAVILGFAECSESKGLEDYCRWIRSVAEARWAGAGVSRLPWWAPAKHVDEIAVVDRHPDSQTFDGQRLAEERASLELSEFVDRFEPASGYGLDELASRHRSTRHLTRRIEFSMLAVSRYGLKACEIAALLGKGRNSVTRWLNEGLRRERHDPRFARRLDAIDAEISRR